MKDYPNERDCEHDQLRRSCPICAVEADYADLLAQYNALKDEIVQRQDTEDSLTKWVHDLGEKLDALKEALKSIMSIRKTAQAMEMPEAWCVAATQMESIARRALEEK